MTLFQSQQELLFHEVSETYRKFLADKDALEKAAAEEAAASRKRVAVVAVKRRRRRKKVRKDFEYFLGILNPEGTVVNIKVAEIQVLKN